MKSLPEQSSHVPSCAGRNVRAEPVWHGEIGHVRMRERGSLFWRRCDHQCVDLGGRRIIKKSPVRKVAGGWRQLLKNELEKLKMLLEIKQLVEGSTGMRKAKERRKRCGKYKGPPVDSRWGWFSLFPQPGSRYHVK